MPLTQRDFFDRETFAVYVLRKLKCSGEADGKIEHSKSNGHNSLLVWNLRSIPLKQCLTPEDMQHLSLRRSAVGSSRYVAEVQPENVEQFASCAPPEVTRAMRETVDSMLGSLPARYFSVSITSVSENLAQFAFQLDAHRLYVSKRCFPV